MPQHDLSPAAGNCFLQLDVGTIQATRVISFTDALEFDAVAGLIMERLVIDYPNCHVAIDGQGPITITLFDDTVIKGRFDVFGVVLDDG